MRILVTSADGANGNGYGAILGFGPEGEFTGPFSSDPRIADPRGLSVDPSGALIYVNAATTACWPSIWTGTSCATRSRYQGWTQAVPNSGPMAAITSPCAAGQRYA
jgi:hypothetical protein